MALTRAMLKGMGLTDEQVSAIIEEHVSVTDSLKQQRDDYKKQLDDVGDIKKELEDLKKGISDDDWEGKYNKEHEQFEKYKSEVAEKEKLNKVQNAYTKLLKDCKVGEKHIGSIVKVTDFTSMELDDKGELKDVDKLKEAINADYSGFIQTDGTKGADVENHPEGGEPDEKPVGRAAELAAKYHENLYGKAKEA